jgi:hypothetical protein
MEKGEALDKARATLTTNSNPCPTLGIVCVCVFLQFLEEKVVIIPKNICLTLATNQG